MGLMADGRVSDQRFERVRGRLFGIAYRMLASRAEAEDVVQETYVRWHQAEQDAIRNHEAWLVTAATRLAIDRLRALKTEREAYTGCWLPEPLMSEMPAPDRNLELGASSSWCSTCGNAFLAPGRQSDPRSSTANPLRACVPTAS
jgi:DNA-directed RNA polymerase specialized sigma24 family protein